MKQFESKLSANLLREVWAAFVVLGLIIKRNGEMVFNPRPDEVLRSGDTLITIGHQRDLEALQGALQPEG